MSCQLELTNEAPGKLAVLTEFDNETKGYVELDAREIFLKRFSDAKYDWKTKTTTQSLFHHYDNLPNEAEAFHRNYIEYLTRCWKDHLGVVFTPEILWYTLLGELILAVQGDVEGYRHLFSESDEKQQIVINADGNIMPLDLLIDTLKEYVPTNTDLFLPEFSTANLRARHAMYASFCDMCSPYYDYMMLSCNIPLIDVRGEQADYEKIDKHWSELKELFPAERKYMDRVGSVIENIIEKQDDADHWRGMFSLERCGSGGEQLVRGWWSQLYREQPSLPKADNFSPHVAKVSYKSLNDDPPGDYEMQDGLFFSQMKGDFLSPQFGFIVHKKEDPVVTEE